MHNQPAVYDDCLVASARRVVAPYEIIVPLLSNNTISIIAAV
jgi:hypothetical protein